MSNTSLMTRAATIVAEQLGIDADSIKPEATFAELGADSLDTVESVMALEEEFGIEIPDEKAEDLDTLEKVVAFVEENGVKAA